MLDIVIYSISYIEANKWRIHRMLTKMNVLIGLRVCYGHNFQNTCTYGLINRGIQCDVSFDGLGNVQICSSISVDEEFF